MDAFINNCYICFPEMLSLKFFFKIKDEIPIILPTV